MSCVQKGHIIIFTTSKCKNCACYEYNGEMEGFLLPEIDGIKKITEHKLSTVCGQVLKHVKKSYRTLQFHLVACQKKKHLEEVIFQLSCNQYQQTALLLTGKLKVSDTSVNEHIKFGRGTYDIRIFQQIGAFASTYLLKYLYGLC